MQVTGSFGSWRMGSAMKTNRAMPRSLNTDGLDFRSQCSISRTLDLVGDRWTLLIIRDLMWHEKHTFQALQGSAERIPTNILSHRLRRLMELDLVRREQYQERPPRYAYHLSETGRSLEPVLIQIMRWGHTFLGGGMLDRVKAGPRPHREKGPYR